MYMKKILLMDFGSRFTEDIKNVLNELNISFDCVKHDYNFNELSNEIAGIIISGSKDSVYDNGRRCDGRFLRTGVPVLGLCYGHQLVNDDFGGEVAKAKVSEMDVQIEIEIDVDNPLFDGMNHTQKVSMFHNDEVTKLGDGFISLAHGQNCKYAASYNKEFNIYSVQYHPECKTYADYSKEYFANFAKICKI